ncbi:MAG: hypothetical protein AAFV95_03170 [Bacteroidota bacterium]
MMTKDLPTGQAGSFAAQNFKSEQALSDVLRCKYKSLGKISGAFPMAYNGKMGLKPFCLTILTEKLNKIDRYGPF